MALPGGVGCKEPACECKIREASLGGEDPLEEGMATTPVVLPGESQGERNLGGYGSQGCKSQIQLKRLSTRNLKL